MPMLVTALEAQRLVVRDALASDAAAFLAYMHREQYWHDLPMPRFAATMHRPQFSDRMRLDVGLGCRWSSSAG
jgi:hypothetical protein